MSSHRTLFAILLMTSWATVAVAAEADEGWSKPKRHSGSMVVHPRSGSLPYDPMDFRPSLEPIQRDHYLRSPEWMAAARAEAYSSPDIPAGRALGRDVAASTEPLTARGPARRSSFNGLNRQTSSYLGTSGFPADATLSVGPDKVLQATNVAIRLTTRAGAEIDSKPLNFFLGHDSTDLLFDPKVYYDRLSERFFVVALEANPDLNLSGIWLAVSKTNDPAALSAPSDFCTYRIQGKRANSGADYPSIGINENFFAISVNNFRFGNGTFRRAHVYTMPVDRITDNANGCPTLGIKRFNIQNDLDGLPAFTIQPAQHYSANNLPGSPLFMVSSSALVPANSYHVWRIKAGAGGGAQLSKQKVTGGFSYFIPPVAPQKGNGGDLDSGDPRITQAAFRDGKLWVAHATACGIGPLPNESCILAAEFTPTADGVTMTFNEPFGRMNQFLFWPGIAINEIGDVVTAFQRARPNTFLGIAYNGKRANAEHFDNIRNMRVGGCTLDNFDPNFELNRTGDYVGLQTDPEDGLSFWIAGEYPGTIAGFGCDWKTRVGRAKY